MRPLCGNSKRQGGGSKKDTPYPHRAPLQNFPGGIIDIFVLEVKIKVLHEQKAIPGYEGHYILDPVNKQVYSLKSKRPLKLRYDSTGYPEVHLYRDGIDEYKRVHRLFAESYIPNPDNLPYINHKDEDKTNFSIDNLEWCSASYNQRYGTVNERRGPKISEALRGKPRPYVVQEKGKPVIAISESGEEFWFPSGREAARQLGLKQSKIAYVLSGQRKSTGGYKFYYD